MTRSIFGAAMVLAMLSMGCGCGLPQQAKQQAAIMEVGSSAFVAKMDAGSTTRDQEQAYIRESALNWAAFRDALGLPAPAAPVAPAPVPAPAPAK